MEREIMPNKPQRPKVGISKKLRRGLISVALLGVLSFTLLNGVIGSNNAGFYKIKQGRISGELSVIDKAGWHMQNFGIETEYSVSDTYYFSKSDLDGGAGKEAQPIQVRFVGGGTGEISGSVKYKLPSAADKRIRLHKDYRSYRAIQNDLVRQYTAQVLQNTSTIFTAEQTYSGSKGEFNMIFEQQLREGIYKTKSQQIKTKDADGNDLITTIVEIQKDSNGKPVIAVESVFKKYGIELMQVSVKDIDYDDKIDTLIVQKQEAEQERILARAKAEKAKQDAITAIEQGKAKIAQAKAEEDVKKQRAITQAEQEKAVAVLKAEKEKQVAELNKEKAELEAKALLTKKEAEAKANELLVKAGLTPKEKAEIEMKTKIGVAEQLSKVAVPKIIIGGTENGTGPMDAISVNMLLDIIDKMEDEN
ncbi:SPFH domain-containing protein [Oceanirhabdus sp. W0125-5]|uniref:SPFH domain-containing protein n=1 Tax=Oceanirhabdus sp. W0125-5 TaxID=2999116 RepID=UPI0022F2B2AF|nr:cell envelope integrity protein TolA [Oceanirhabdus sp. W0125-5]WBW97122.1 cell envelope integrity protein TolA [Oceanirhabdus sp. W0125-5]